MNATTQERKEDVSAGFPGVVAFVFRFVDWTI
jgi:hypothetical protein